MAASVVLNLLSLLLLLRLERSYSPERQRRSMGLPVPLMTVRKQCRDRPSDLHLLLLFLFFLSFYFLISSNVLLVGSLPVADIEISLWCSAMAFAISRRGPIATSNPMF